MQSVKPETVTGQPVIIPSGALNRAVSVDLYLPPFSKPGPMQVLLINDGRAAGESQTATDAKQATAMRLAAAAK